MADETKANAVAAAEAPSKVVETVAATATKVVADTAAAEKRARAAAAARKRRAAAKAAAPAKAEKIKVSRAVPKRRKPRIAARKPATVTPERTKTVNFKTNSFFGGFDSIPAFAPFQTLFADAGERGQEVARRSQKVAEELADLTRANVEAFVESGRLAAEGARSLGQDVVATSRQGAEKAAEAIRTLADAKSPTEYLQIQSELARASFDRLVAQSSRLTETAVKIAGEAIQPISNRASASAERINSLVA